MASLLAACTILLALWIGTSGAAVLRFGTLQPLDGPYPYETYSAVNVIEGLVAAFREANDEGALGVGNSIELVLRNHSAQFNAAQSEVSQLINTENVIGIALTS